MSQRPTPEQNNPLQRWRTRHRPETALATLDSPETHPHNLRSSLRHTRFIEDGVATLAPADTTLSEALAFAEGEPERFVFLLLPQPTQADITALADAWSLHPVLVEDLERAGERPKLERYGDTLFTVVRAAHYNDADEDVSISEFHILVRHNAIAILCQDGRWIDGSDRFTRADWSIDPEAPGRTPLLTNPQLLKLGPEAVLYQFLDEIVDGFTPVFRGIETDKEQIESQVFSGDPKVAERIYRLSQEVIDLQHAVSPLNEVLADFQRGFKRYGISHELSLYLQDVSDNLSRAQVGVVELRDTLAQVLSVNATLVSQRQSEDMKRISSWAAILFAPTLIGAVYGMNFDSMPELHWELGYPLAIAAMGLLGVVLFSIFKRKKWL